MSTANYVDSASPVLSASCTSNNGMAIQAFNDVSVANAKGLWAQCNGTDSWAVFATATNGSNSRGVVGVGGFAGVFGESSTSTGYGVYGQATAATGTNHGVHGRSNSSSGSGVYGHATAVTGVNYGVYGMSNSSSGYGVFSYGKFAATGTKSAVVPSSKGHVEFYAEEATEVWFSDYGEGRLVQGRARINLDPHFLETVCIDGQSPLKVFVQLEGEASGVYVHKDGTGFNVIELQHGKSDAPFSYRVVAKRKGYERHRLHPTELPDHGPATHP